MDALYLLPPATAVLPSSPNEPDSPLCTPTNTPPQSPLKKKKDTPEPVRKLEGSVGKWDKESDLMKNEKQTIDRALAALPSVNDSPHRRELCQRIASVIKPPDSPNSHRTAAENVHVGAQWVTKLGGSLNRLHGGAPIVTIVDIDHITSADDGMGNHFCPTQKGLTNIRTNPENGVFVAEFQVEKGVKESSFFPVEIADEKELLRLIKSGTFIASTRNMQLFSIQLKTTTMYAMQYMQNEVLIRSYFPLFFVGDLEGTEAEIDVAGLGNVQRVALIQHLKTAPPAQLNKTLLFNTGGRLLFDLSSVVKVSGIKKGVCFWVNAATINYREPIARDLFGAKSRPPTKALPLNLSQMKIGSPNKPPMHSAATKPATSAPNKPPHHATAANSLMGSPTMPPMHSTAVKPVTIPVTCSPNKPPLHSATTKPAVGSPTRAPLNTATAYPIMDLPNKPPASATATSKK